MRIALRSLICLILFGALGASHEIPVTVAAGGAYPAAKMGGNYMYNFYLPPAPSSTAWAPAWSPDGKTIAVGMHGSIWTVDIASGIATELTYNDRYHSSPAWSPDGKWIVYTADAAHQAIQLEAVNVATGESHALTSDNQMYLDPVFSPDGTKLAYVSTQPTGYFNVFIRPIKDGKWAGDPVAVTHDNQYQRERLYFGSWDIHIEPTWTPDGKSLVMLSNQDVPLGSGALWVVPAVENGMDRAVQILDEQTLYRARPDVSIDGKRLIYSSMAGGADQFHHLYVLPVTGGYPYKMTFGDHDDFHPRWSPDGELIAYISNQGGLPHLMTMESYGGRKRRYDLEQRNWKRPMGSLDLTVVDEKGKPLHARVQGAASDGKFYAPPDAYSRVASEIGHNYHTDGTGSVSPQPTGKMTVQVAHGFEYTPREIEVEIQAGETKKLEVKLQPVIDMNAKGWYSGSTHVHMNYGGNLRNTLENLIFMSKAEDQDIVNELVANKDNRILDWQYYVEGGAEHPVSTSDPNLVMIVGEEYRPPFYGHTFFIGLRDHLISPFLTGYEGTGVDSLYPSNTDMFRKAIAQGAVTGYVHPYSGDDDPLKGALGGAKGFPVDAALGTAHCLEWSNPTRAGFDVWSRMLNNDIRVTPTGGEDSISNLHISKLVGSVRTYAYMGKELSASAWKKALLDGRTFFTTGPLLEFEIEGKVAGEDVKVRAAGGTVTAKATVTSISPIAKAVIYRNGRPYQQLEIAEPDHLTAKFEGELPADESAWYSLYVEGPSSKWLDTSFVQAGTNAIRVYVASDPIRDKASAEYFVQWIDKLHALADDWLWWRSQEEKDHVYAQFDEAKAIYEKLVSESDTDSTDDNVDR